MKILPTTISALILVSLCSCGASSPSIVEMNQCYICQRQTASSISFDDGYICADCFLSSPEDFIRCQDCGTVTHKDPWINLQVCENCREAYYRTCVLCEDRLFHRDEMARVGKYCLCAQCAFDFALRFDTEEEIIRYIEEISSLPYSGFYNG